MNDSKAPSRVSSREVDLLLVIYLAVIVFSILYPTTFFSWQNARAILNNLADIADINAIISKLHDGQHIFYMDIGQKFLSPDGSISREIMADFLHPTAKGYEIWGEAVKDKLAELMK